MHSGLAMLSAWRYWHRVLRVPSASPARCCCTPAGTKNRVSSHVFPVTALRLSLVGRLSQEASHA
ncbi:hypothetical protein ADT30_08705 [Xylella fastidiosa]|nr:hypothetical protein ADT30_08705 [Xylella fastidiosa]